MSGTADERRLNEVTEKVSGCAYTVANSLGAGFWEKVYENSLAHELRESGLMLEQQRGIEVRYDGIVVGAYSADLRWIGLGGAQGRKGHG